MSLETIINNSSFLNRQKEDDEKRLMEAITEEKLMGILPQLRDNIAFFRKYPDIFVDVIKGEDCKFQFYGFQRVTLREMMRHRYVYVTNPRAYSKSFLAVMGLMLKAILYPGSHLFVTTGGK